MGRRPGGVQTIPPGVGVGAHPLGLWEYPSVNSGEISSSDSNRRHMEMFGYQCTLQTDTEVITYIVDYLRRKQKLTLQEVAKVIAASFWSTIERKPAEERAQEELLRKMFPSLLITGPFATIFGYPGGLMALNDRLKLRSMVVAERGDRAYIASEECAIRVIEPELDYVRAPRGGEPVIFELYGGVR